MGDPGMYQHIRAITPMFPVMSITKAHPANVSGGILAEYCIYDHEKIKLQKRIPRSG